EPVQLAGDSAPYPAPSEPRPSRPLQLTARAPMAPARPPRFPAAAALAALLALLLAAPGARAGPCNPAIANCADCGSSGNGQSSIQFCIQCTPGYKLTYQSATTSTCTAPLPLGPSYLGCYSTAVPWSGSVRQQITASTQPSRAGCRTLAASEGYAYFGMTGTSGASGFCYMSNSLPSDAVASNSCTYTCPTITPAELCGGTNNVFSIYATEAIGGTCDGGWYDASNVCNPCNVTNCATCPTVSTCSACKSGYGLGSSTSCDKCDDADCDVCTNSGQGSCTKCKNNKLLDAGKCVDTCSPGKWKNGDKCDPCKDNCKSCTTFDTCGSCKDNYFVDNGGNCGNCPSNCKACPSASSCTTCKDGYEFSGTECVLSQVVCNPGTYSSNGACNNCPGTCSACTSSECTACNPGKKLHQGGCLDSCPDEYSDESGVCDSCSNHCKTCTSNTTCTVCKTGYRLINNKCFVDTTPTAAAAGDPHLVGFGGQSYSFCEHADGAHCLGRTFSMLSAPAYALNTHITRMAGPDAWPFAGAWMTGIGFRFGNILSVTLEMATDVEYKVVPDGRGEDTTRAILPKDWSKVFASMRVNGRNVLGLIGTGDTLLHGVAGEASVHFPDRRHKGDETDGTVAVITTPGMRIKLFLESEDVTHLDFEITLFSSAINAANTHGLLGQSWPGRPECRRPSRATSWTMWSRAACWRRASGTAALKTPPPPPGPPPPRRDACWAGSRPSAAAAAAWPNNRP
ncbi:MAG: hypothetical protein J3K34DRAFT_480962, partial [Monoraphidium minutum]